MTDSAVLVIGTTTSRPASPVLVAPPGAPLPPRTSLLVRLLVRLARLLGLHRMRTGRLTNEDVRVLAILGVALVVAFGSNASVGAPAAAPAVVEAPAEMPAAPPVADAPVPAPAGDGMVDDPTSKGQITATTAHGLGEIRGKFGPAILSASCWDKHEWNPKSDHPRGRACDVYTSRAGQFAAGDGLTNGNRLASWLREHADELGVAYVIWQGRIWSPERGDRAYKGGGVYDPTDATGGHYDHLHVSFRR